MAYDQQLADVEHERDLLRAALVALTMWYRNQLCFRTSNGIPMEMSRHQERMARTALAGSEKRASDG